MGRGVTSAPLSPGMEMDARLPVSPMRSRGVRGVAAGSTSSCTCELICYFHAFQAFSVYCLQFCMDSESYAGQPCALARRAQRRHREPARVDEGGLAAGTYSADTCLHSFYSTAQLNGRACEGVCGDPPRRRSRASGSCTGWVRRRSSQ